MLGSQSWLAAVGIPTFLVTGFIASRKRLAYQWKEELMDPGSEAYPTLTDEHMEFIRRVAPDSLVKEAEASANPKQVNGVLGIPMTKDENIGLRVEENFLEPHEANVFLNQIRQWSDKLGCSLDPRKVQIFEQQMEQVRKSDFGLDQQTPCSEGSNPKTGFIGCLRSSWAWLGQNGSGKRPKESLGEFDSSFLSQIRVVSDHPESAQPIRAPWGSGDRMKGELMPASLRNLVHRVQLSCPNIGRLRHVYIEYSPGGLFYHEPTTPRHYDGHDYVFIPLRRDAAQTVVTFSPVMRSRFSSLRDIMRKTWTTHDIDCLVPHGCLLRVYGTARYDWGWSVRPGPVWFGSRLNPLTPASADMPSSPGLISTWLKQLRCVVTSPFFASKMPVAASLGHQPGGKCVGGAQHLGRDAALVVLHFEGPRSKKKERSMLLEPEIFIFGRAPTVKTFETWSDDQPTKEDIHKVGVLRFMFRHYYDLLTVG